MKKIAFLPLLMAACLSLPMMAQQFPFGASVTWDRHSLMVDGRRVCPVMGEVHYSRIPADEWPAEVRKMKEGGVTLIATYVFWNHVEEQEGSYQFTFRYKTSEEMVKRGYFCVDKGSVTVNGVSLTVCRPTEDTFQVCIIPYTYENTNFHSIRKGTTVNLEFDILGKYIARMSSLLEKK